jgi:hypothetical protein
LCNLAGLAGGLNSFGHPILSGNKFVHRNLAERGANHQGAFDAVCLTSLPANPFVVTVVSLNLCVGLTTPRPRC